MVLSNMTTIQAWHQNREQLQRFCNANLKILNYEKSDRLKLSVRAVLSKLQLRVE